MLQELPQNFKKPGHQLSFPSLSFTKMLLAQLDIVLSSVTETLVGNTVPGEQGKLY